MADEPQKIEIDPNDPVIRSLVLKAVEDATAPLKANRDEILEEKRGIKEKFDALQQQWAGYDPIAMKSLMDKISNDEEVRLISEGKFDEVMANRTAVLRADFEKQLGARDTRITELETGIGTKDGKISRLVIDRKVQEAASAAECLGSAVPDIILRAQTVFSLDENDAPVAKDRDGSTLYGKDGKSFLSPAEWLEGEREGSAHWWAPSSGGGAAGGTGDRKGPGVDIENLTPRQKMELAISGGAK